MQCVRACVCMTGIPTTKPIESKKAKKEKAKKKEKEKGRIVVDDLMKALDESTASSSRKQTALSKTAPKHFDRTKRAKMEVAETAQFKNVFSMNAFQANPMDSIAQHIKNTVALSKM